MTVNGTTTNLNSTNLVIEDKNIIIADVASPTDTTADGAGITIKGATDKTFNWVNSTGAFTSSEPISAPSLTISGNVNIGGVLDLTNAGVISALDMSNNSIVGVNKIDFADPGPSEGLAWTGGNFALFESPNDLTTNSSGNLQFATGTIGAYTRRMTINSSGQVEIPVATGTAPLVISSTTAVTNLNADLLDGQHGSYYAPIASPTFTGTPLSTTAAADTNTTQIATTAYVIGQASSSNPIALGTVAAGTSLKYARADHVHPTTGLALLSGAIFTGQIQSTLANSTTTGGGQIYLNGVTGNRIDFNANGVAAPTFTTRSTGTKIVLYPSLSASAVDYAIGIENGTLWNSVERTSQSFKWYGGTTVAATLTGAGLFTAVSKSFDIEHPTKPDMRLRYGSLEGPENGVYVRGVTKENVIELPDYWTGLVDESTITVSLTSVGKFQKVYLEKIEGNKIYIGGRVKEISYVVFGERKDIDKITVEY